MIRTDILALIGLIATLIHGLGFLAALHAIMSVRTSQGAIAWALTLVTFPYVSLPLYLIFGRNKFMGYVDVRRARNQKLRHLVDGLATHVPRFRAEMVGDQARFQPLEKLAGMPFTIPNCAQLLVNGEATFNAIFAGIDQAKQYILVEFFIVHDDELGRELKSRLLQRARAGVAVHFLFDEVGSHKLPKAYVNELRHAGVEVQAFGTTRGWRNRFQLNFRNHRKIVVVDGNIAYVGGLNVGDEYMGRDPKIGPWRDTHLMLTGPAVLSVQLAFIEDWHWATGKQPALNWVPRAADNANQKILVLPSGPADDVETCGLFFVHAINSAEHRLWIVSPYFVPDPEVICALKLAALRGVDVRIMLPQNPDHLLVYLSAFSFLKETASAEIKIYRYQPGFVHQKVLLIDNQLAAVGTANMDNRSIRLNFEITIVVADPSFAAEVAAMLEQDFTSCQQARPDELDHRSLWFRLWVRVARLMAPIQ